MRNLAAERRSILASTGPDAMGYKRFDRVQNRKGEVYIFLGVRDGEAHLERADGKEPVFIKIETVEFQYWKRME